MGEIWDLIESVFESFPSYSYDLTDKINSYQLIILIIINPHFMTYLICLTLVMSKTNSETRYLILYFRVHLGLLGVKMASRYVKHISSQV